MPANVRACGLEVDDVLYWISFVEIPRTEPGKGEVVGHARLDVTRVAEPQMRTVRLASADAVVSVTVSRFFAPLGPTPTVNSLTRDAIAIGEAILLDGS